MNRSPSSPGRTGRLKRTSLSRESKKTRARRVEATLWRRERVSQWGYCWICGTSEKKPIWPIADHNRICIHEIACIAGGRLKAIDSPLATLVLCWRCNQEAVTDKTLWPEARQLSLVQRMAPDDYDLAGYNQLVGFGDNRITQAEVDEYLIEF